MSITAYEPIGNCDCSVDVEPTLEDRDVLGLLAIGGFGRVYLVRNKRMETFEALKVLRDEWVQDAEVRERFLREATNAAAVRHANVVRVIDWGTTVNGVPFLAMEYVEGPTLFAVLQRAGRLPVDSAIRIATGIANALIEAHRVGIIHRDLKPSNILLATSPGEDPAHAGTPKVADFGLARAMRNPSQRVTRAGVSLGTLAYMSPEQLASGELADARSDVFALGLVLYEMLTGVRALGEDPLSANFGDNPRKIRELNPDVSRYLAAVVHRAMDRDPMARYQSAAALRAALLRNRRVTLSTTPTTWMRRTSLLLAMGLTSSGLQDAPVTRLPTELAAVTVRPHNDFSFLPSDRGKEQSAVAVDDSAPAPPARQANRSRRASTTPANSPAAAEQHSAASSDSFVIAPGVAIEDLFKMPSTSADVTSQPLEHSSPTTFMVQFAAVLDAAVADSIAATIRVHGRRSHVARADVAGSAVHRVVIGPFATRKEAERVRRSSRRDAVIYTIPPH